MRLNHIAIAVKDLDVAIATYETLLGISCTERETVEIERVHVAKFQLENVRIELVCPMDDSSPISSFLEKRGGGLHHIALEPNDYEASLQRLSGKVEFLDKPHTGSENMTITFIHPKSCERVLTEICKKN